MSEKKTITDSSIARMAGNIAGSLIPSTAISYPMGDELIALIARESVRLARAIAVEIERAEFEAATSPEATP